MSQPQAILFASVVAAAGGIIVAILQNWLANRRLKRIDERSRRIEIYVNHRLTVALAGSAAVKRKLGLAPLPEEIAAENELLRQAEDIHEQRKTDERAH